MMRKLLFLFICLMTLTTITKASLVTGSKGRALVALPSQSRGIYLSWRMLSTDDNSTTYDVLRNGAVVATVSNATSYNDTEGSARDSYSVIVKRNGNEIETTKAVSPWDNIYKTLKADRPAGGTTPSGEKYAYFPSDCEVADADGDGEYELFTDTDAATFWTRYQKERMVELAFEGHRFWDVRRWKEADLYFTNITEMKLFRNENGTITYVRQNVSRQWDNKMYLFPIPQTERLKNPNLEQNPGW